MDKLNGVVPIDYGNPSFRFDHLPLVDSSYYAVKLGMLAGPDGDGTNNRFRDMDTLKYALRALESHTAWVRNVFIVTNGQVPSWLNSSNSRVHIVTHGEIFPNQSDLPTFNSHAIEQHLHNIPGMICLPKKQ